MVPPLVAVGLADRLVLADAPDGVLDHDALADHLPVVDHVRPRTWLGAGRAASPITHFYFPAATFQQRGSVQDARTFLGVAHADEVLTAGFTLFSRRIHATFTRRHATRALAG
jgi:hypothetical protein